MLIACNWKMFCTPSQELKWVEQNKQILTKLAQNHTLILFPSFLSLQPLATLLKGTPILLGAQDCSEHEYGPFTGQTSAQALAELGCSYVVVGHLERRQLGETQEQIARKAAQATKAGLKPIVCVETLDQVIPHTITAYEPSSAIGTGITPSPTEIAATLNKLPADSLRLYGGSVSSKNAAEIGSIPSLGGLLIGKASLDIQELGKIVESLPK